MPDHYIKYSGKFFNTAAQSQLRSNKQAVLRVKLVDCINGTYMPVDGTFAAGTVVEPADDLRFIKFPQNGDTVVHARFMTVFYPDCQYIDSFFQDIIIDKTVTAAVFGRLLDHLRKTVFAAFYSVDKYLIPG